MSRKIFMAVLILALVGCSTDPVQQALKYRNGYSVELLGFNVKQNDAGEPVAVNMEIAIENRNSVAGLSVLTVKVKQYDAANTVLGEDLIAIPLKDLAAYGKQRYYPVLKKIHGNIAAISVSKAPVDDPAAYMKYREFAGLK